MCYISPLNRTNKPIPQLTFEPRKIFLQVRVLNFVSQDISLVEEEDDGSIEEPLRMDGGVEQRQTLIHTVLMKKIITYHARGLGSVVNQSHQLFREYSGNYHYRVHPVHILYFEKSHQTKSCTFFHSLFLQNIVQ